MADVLDRHRIRRVLVVGEGKLGGIDSRSDLVRALAQVQGGDGDLKREDAVLHKTIYENVQSLPWLDAVYLNVVVKDASSICAGLSTRMSSGRPCGFWPSVF